MLKIANSASSMVPAEYKNSTLASACDIACCYTSIDDVITKFADGYELQAGFTICMLMCLWNITIRPVILGPEMIKQSS